ncbi:uncharacterized protein K460DRAFT_407521 [Cucurbitaria berberidis CBS 394.84]|uniref:Uncharacterized protein n=1 Tax=Cucurbitaria berberidis CBS 394.84 TaxID=1168544 RepID=A0A9P4L5P0_9PLEO|nr:uncharacterized protein K460DRAFT_407521 [Cucurbitaria berberidis CBS 394.84]KAF1843156.1 hypothetical protein K460DRAFT_407521 [Cucurbitaria berberidis CBS 394.84]
MQKSPSITYSAVDAGNAEHDTIENNGTQDDSSDTCTVSSLSDCSGDEASSDEYNTLANETWSIEKAEVDNPAVVSRAELPVAGWPTEARVLHGVSAWLIVGNILLFLLPVPFLVLAITAVGFNSNPISERGQMVLRAMNLGPTIFPLVFASVSSCCLRNIALIRIESGVRLQTLEELLSSQSVVSAIACFVKLRSVNLLSILLLIFWMLSPLGGQSSLRLLYETNSTTSTSNTISYSSSNAVFELNEQTVHTASTIMAANLIAPDTIKNGAFDLWGDVKVPRIDWTKIDNDSTTAMVTLGSGSAAKRNEFTSWTGVKIRDVNPSRRYQFDMKYDYIDLTCTPHLSSRNPVDILAYLTRSDIHTGPFDPPEDSAASIIAQDAIMEAEGMIFNRTVKAYGVHVPSPRPAATFFRYAYNSTNQKEKNTETASYLTYFLYGARYTSLGPQVFQCLPTYYHLEVGVRCQPNSQCNIFRMRRIPPVVTTHSILEGKNEIPCHANLGSLPCLLLNTNTLKFFIEWWATILSTPTQTNGTDPYDIYIAALQGKGFELGTAGRLSPHWDSINATNLSARLTLAFNTYWQAIQWQGHTMLTNTSDVIQEPLMANAGCTEESDILMYRVSIPWIMVLVFTTLILLTLATVNLVVSFMIIAPDLLGYVSTLTRSPAGKSPVAPFHTETGTTLDGAERDRLLRNRIICIEDMSPGAEVGYIAIRLHCENAERLCVSQPERLRKGRLYI